MLSIHCLSYVKVHSQHTTADVSRVLIMYLSHNKGNEILLLAHNLKYIRLDIF